MRNYALIFVCKLFFWVAPAYTAKDIQIIHVDEIQSTDSFYKRFASAPVIIKGVYDENPFLKNLTLETLESSLKNGTLITYYNQYDKKPIPSETFFDEFNKGIGQLNVLDHPLLNTSFADQIKAPFFFQDNWYVDTSVGSKGHDLCLVISAEGRVTQWHEDGDGEQVWMFLAQGKKEWLFLPPPSPTNLKKNISDYDENSPELLRGILQSGQLIFFPPGWSHKVITHEKSFGVTAYLMNAYQINQTVDALLYERTRHGIPGGVHNPKDEAFIYDALNKGKIPPAAHPAVEHQLERLRNHRRSFAS